MRQWIDLFERRLDVAEVRKQDGVWKNPTARDLATLVVDRDMRGVAVGNDVWLDYAFNDTHYGLRGRLGLPEDPFSISYEKNDGFNFYVVSTDDQKESNKFDDIGGRDDWISPDFPENQDFIIDGVHIYTDCLPKISLTNRAFARMVGRKQITESMQDHRDFDTWFAGSVVVNRDGSPMICYHGTSSDFNEFHPLSHFGTAKAASHRLRDLNMRDGSRTIPVYLAISDPLRVTDQDASDEATFINSVAAGRYHDADIDINVMRRKGVAKALEHAGYDGMVYKNRMEDRGRDSWVVLSPKQVRSIFD